MLMIRIPVRRALTLLSTILRIRDKNKYRHGRDRQHKISYSDTQRDTLVTRSLDEHLFFFNSGKIGTCTRRGEKMVTLGWPECCNRTSGMIKVESHLRTKFVGFHKLAAVR